MKSRVIPGLWLLGSLALAACSRTQAAPAAPPPPKVSVAHPVVRPLRAERNYHGRLEAVHSVELRPRVSGHIAAVRFAEGARVKKDQVLFEIDARPFQQEVLRLEAEERRAASQLTLARANLARGEHLLQEGAAARGDLDQLHAAESGGVASLDSIRASLALARLNLEYCRVRAPFEGRASSALITAGNLVSNADVLTRIVTDDKVYAYFDVDEAAFLALNTERAATHAPATVQLGLSIDPGYPYSGQLDFVDNQVDPRTGTIRARAVFANLDQRLTPGLFARILLSTDAPRDALLIDDKALLTDQNRKYVYVLDAEGRAQRRDVKVGRSVEGMRVVESGLSAQDRVLVQGIQKVFMPGMPVQAEEVALATPERQP